MAVCVELSLPASKRFAPLYSVLHMPQVSSSFIEYYSGLPDKPAFLHQVALELGINDKALTDAANTVAHLAASSHQGLTGAASRIATAAQPMYMQLFKAVAEEQQGVCLFACKCLRGCWGLTDLLNSSAGIQFLVGLRADILQILRSNPAFSMHLRSLSDNLR